jgi:propanol-preferring alcohol dehydrogenase
MMKAMLLDRITDLSTAPHPLRLAELPRPVPQPGEVLIRVTVCGVCHTELDEIEGRTPPAFFPIVLGHQVVGEVVAAGPAVQHLQAGDRVGVAWIFSACGHCRFCRAGLENLCPDFQATGRDVHGGYAEYMTVPEAFAHPLPATLQAAEAAPLLCAGAIGFRALRLGNLREGARLGLTGFGASAHLVLKMARHLFPGIGVYVFARSAAERHFALELGALWAGATTDTPPEKLDTIIDTTPAWTPVTEALRHLEPGGRLVINAIRKEEQDKNAWLQLDYPGQLWLEKEIKSVANVTRRDVREFLQLAAEIPILPAYTEYPLEDANLALLELKAGRIRGAKVLRIAADPS